MCNIFDALIFPHPMPSTPITHASVRGCRPDNGRGAGSSAMVMILDDPLYYY